MKNNSLHLIQSTSENKMENQNTDSTCSVKVPLLLWRHRSFSVEVVVAWGIENWTKSSVEMRVSLKLN